MDLGDIVLAVSCLWIESELNFIFKALLTIDSVTKQLYRTLDVALASK